MELDFERVLEAVDNSARRVVAELRAVENVDAPAIGKWTVGELACHLAHIYGLYPGLVVGQPSPVEDLYQMSAIWDRYVQEHPSDRDPLSAAERVDAGAAEFIANLRTLSPDELVGWHGGVKLPAANLGTVLINEAEVHGWDLARAEGRRFDLDPDHARLIIDGLQPMLPHYIREDAARGFTASFDFRIRGGSRTFWFFDDGVMTLEPPSSRSVDCRVLVDPVAYVLVGWGRVGKWGPILRAKLLSWGRKPWLALKLPSLFWAP